VIRELDVALLTAVPRSRFGNKLSLSVFLHFLVIKLTALHFILYVVYCLPYLHCFHVKQFVCSMYFLSHQAVL